MRPKKSFVRKALPIAYANIPENQTLETGALGPIPVPRTQQFWFHLFEGTNDDLINHCWNQIPNQALPDAKTLESAKILVQKFTESHKFANTSTANVHMKVYWISLRQDWDASGPDPVVELQTGLTNAVRMTNFQHSSQNNAGSNPGPLFITPFMSPRFCQKFKITKVKKYTIKPGAERWVSLKNNYGATVSYRQTSDFVALKRLWRGCIISVYGQVNFPSNAGEITADNPPVSINAGTSTGELGEVFKTTWHWKYIEPIGKTVTMLCHVYPTNTDSFGNIALQENNAVISSRTGNPIRVVSQGLAGNNAPDAGISAETAQGILANQNYPQNTELGQPTVGIAAGPLNQI